MLEKKEKLLYLKEHNKKRKSKIFDLENQNITLTEMIKSTTSLY